MAYVNEEISDEDYEKYNLAEIDKNRDANYEEHWAIDRERDMWLRQYNRSIDIENNGEEVSVKWCFYYKGYLTFVETEEIEKKYNEEKKEAYKHRKIIELEIPQEIENEKEQILKDLKEAFEEAYGNPYFGFYKKDKNKTCKIDLDYNGKVI